MKNLYKIQDELYIISDKEKSSYCIKECPMAGLNIDRCDCQIFTACSNKVGNIILTTNKLLIKDGVQAIDDEFLEWFVKNPNCESVEIRKIEDELISPKNPKIRFNALQDPPSFISAESLNNMILTYKYKIIIPKEEPKQDLEKEMFELEQELDIPSHLRWHNSKPKQETLEEAALDYSGYEEHRMDFIAGAKWQQERMYSEEDMNKYSDYVLMFSAEKTFKLPLPPKEWFEQFKKK